MARLPRVSVVIPTFNRRETVGEAIDSVLSQEGAEVEVLVVDDGSTDGTAEVAQAFAPRVSVIRQANSGAGAARTAGLAATTAPLVAFLDADDRWHPTAAAALGRALNAHPAALVARGAAKSFLDESGECWMFRNGEVRIQRNFTLGRTSEPSKIFARMMNGSNGANGANGHA